MMHSLSVPASSYDVIKSDNFQFDRIGQRRTKRLWGIHTTEEGQTTTPLSSRNSRPFHYHETFPY